MRNVTDRLRTWWLPVGLAVLVLLEVRDAYADDPVRRVVTAGAMLLAALALGRRRSLPAQVAVAAALLVLVAVLVQPDLSAQPLFTPFVVMVAAMFSLGMHAGRRTFTLGLGVAAAVLLALEAVQVVAGRPFADVVPSLLFWAVAAGAGRLVHLSRLEARTERERAEHAAVAERSRIARELHDVVAHSLSVMVIQASVEARLLGDSQESTARTLRSIETTGREALVELRRLLGLLRTDRGEPAPSLQPLPSLAGLAADGGMLDDVRRAGHDVSLEVVGEPREVPGGADLSAYRVVQEALTNAVRHSPGAPVRVVVEHAPDSVRVEVSNGPPGAAGGGARSGVEGLGTGHGLDGMRERVRLYDGQLDAGPTEPGGWTVHASFPLSMDRV